MQPHRIRAAVIPALAALALAACNDSPLAAGAVDRPSLGNGFPGNGRHITLYKFNIIGHPGSPGSELLNDQGKRMFVKLSGKTRVNLSAGPFDILDADGTDGTAAFQLPDPDPDGDGQTAYGVYVRPKGKPNQRMSVSTCATADWDNDPLTADEELCSLEVAVLVRGTGKPKVENVSKQLLTACVDTTGDGLCDERVFLFDERARDYLWSVDNNGLRNVEVRFLEIPQNIGLTP